GRAAGPSCKHPTAEHRERLWDRRIAIAERRAGAFPKKIWKIVAVLGPHRLQWKARASDHPWFPVPETSVASMILQRRATARPMGRGSVEILNSAAGSSAHQPFHFRGTRVPAPRA